MTKKQELERQLKETESQMELLMVVGIVLWVPFFVLLFLIPLIALIFILPFSLLFIILISWSSLKLKEKRDNLRIQLSSIRGYQLPKILEQRMLTWGVFFALILSVIVIAVVVGLTYV